MILFLQNFKTKELRQFEPKLYMPLLCDANTGWQRHEAMLVVNAVKDLDVYIEQPCLTYEECLSVREHCPLPMVLDESMDDIGNLCLRHLFPVLDRYFISIFVVVNHSNE